MVFITNQGCTCSCTCSCLPWWFYALHLCGLGYDFVSRIPYKIKGKKTHVLGGPATWFYKGNCHGDRFSLHIMVSSVDDGHQAASTNCDSWPGCSKYASLAKAPWRDVNISRSIGAKMLPLAWKTLRPSDAVCNNWNNKRFWPSKMNDP